MKRPRALTLTVVATLAIGIGALTATLGIVRATLWRSPPFADAEGLLVLNTTVTTRSDPLRTARWSYPLLQRLRETTRTLEHVANFTPTALTLTGTDLTEPLEGEFVSTEYFAALAVGPALGRLFVLEEDRAPGGVPVALLSWDLWQRRFGGESAAIGRTVGINGQFLTIIGVMPAGFRGLSNGAQLWLPTTMAPRLTYDAYLTTDQLFISAVARRRQGVATAQVNAELATLAAAAFRERPVVDGDTTLRGGATATPLTVARVAPLQRQVVLLLLGAVVLVYLLACANVTSLLLARAVSRRREAAVRAALGATPGALVRRFAAEGAGLVAIAGSAALWIAWAASHYEVPVSAWGLRNPYGNIAGFAEPAFDAATVAMGVALTLLTMPLVALAPAIAATRGDLVNGLREGARAAAGAGMSLRRVSARGMILAVESALAAMLLVVGALMVESFQRMRATPVGVDADHVITFLLRPSEVAIPVAAAPDFVARTLEAIAAVPGVVSASVDGGAPLSGSASSGLRISGRAEPAPDDPATSITRHYVAPDHFKTLGIPLVRGRTFTDADRAGSPGVAVISEGAARRFWPGQDPIGQRVWFAGGSAFDSPERSVEIVGVVGDVLYKPIDREPNTASFYTSYRQFTYAWRTYFVRTAGDPVAVLPALREAIRRVDADLPLTEVRTMRELFGASWERNRFEAGFFGGFSLLALLLAATGIYAVVTHAVAQRSREMAIRLAIGSSPGGLMRLVVREGMTFPMAGLIVGTAGALALSGLLRGVLYGVAPTDLRVLGSSLGVLAFVGAAACAIPGVRAMRANPQDALRAD